MSAIVKRVATHAAAGIAGAVAASGGLYKLGKIAPQGATWSASGGGHKIRERRLLVKVEAEKVDIDEGPLLGWGGIETYMKIGKASASGFMPVEAAVVTDHSNTTACVAVKFADGARAAVRLTRFGPRDRLLYWRDGKWQVYDLITSRIASDELNSQNPTGAAWVTKTGLFMFPRHTNSTKLFGSCPIVTAAPAGDNITSGHPSMKRIYRQDAHNPPSG